LTLHGASAGELGCYSIQENRPRHTRHSQRGNYRRIGREKRVNAFPCQTLPE
jgi:hypothetical protein